MKVILKSSQQSKTRFLHRKKQNIIKQPVPVFVDANLIKTECKNLTLKQHAKKCPPQTEKDSVSKLWV